MKLMRILTGLVFCVAAVGLVQPSSPVQAQEKPNDRKPRVEKKTYDFTDAGQPMEYALFVPSGYDKAKKSPLVIALHGLGGNPQQFLRTRGLTEQAEKRGYLVAAPMGFNEKGWYGVRGLESPRMEPENLGELSEKDVMNVLALVKKSYNVDPDRVYLMGHSMGGGGTWHLGIKYAQEWAALAPIAPAIFGRNPRDVETIKGTPVILVQGDKDTLVPVAGARRWAEQMKKLGMTHEYIEVAGGTHGSVVAANMPKIFAFFDQHKRPAKRTLPDYQPVAAWPQLPPNLELGAVSAVATDSQDRVFVAHRADKPILVFDREGKFLRAWGDEHIKTPHGLRIDHEGHVWVTDIGHHLVMKFDPAGKLLLALGKRGDPGSKPDQFDRPTDVAIAASGDIYVTDGYGNARVMKFSPDGKLLKQWGSKGKGEGAFNLPHAIVLDAKGNLYVGDRENNRVQVFDADGKFLKQWNESGAPYGLFLAGDRLFVADGRAGWVKVLGLDGTTLGRVGESGTRSGQFQMPHMLCVDSRGDVYVAEVGNKRIQKFTPRQE
jgi:poly(3-hydroxybutyrate) depolymerase/DNA-binding beta-propeller fold protein YncE